MGLEKLLEIGDRNQMMVTQETITLKWLDKRLSWNRNHHHNITQLSLKPHHVWKPDIVLMNVVGGGNWWRILSSRGSMVTRL